MLSRVYVAIRSDSQCDESVALYPSIAQALPLTATHIPCFSVKWESFALAAPRMHRSIRQENHSRCICGGVRQQVIGNHPVLRVRRIKIWQSPRLFYLSRCENNLFSWFLTSNKLIYTLSLCFILSWSLALQESIPYESVLETIACCPVFVRRLENF